MIRLIAGFVALALLPAVAGCGGDDTTKSTTSPKTDETSAQSTALELDASEQQQLDNARAAFTAYCKTKHDEPVGSLAIAESLLTYGDDTQTSDGQLGTVLAKSRDELRACGAKSLAKRLDKALKG
jgi:Flp pilus assembly protein TadD